MVHAETTSCPVCTSACSAERPSGGAALTAAGSTSRHSNMLAIPFGSCGNLMALSHGSIGQQLSHGTHSHSKSQSQAPEGHISRCSCSFNSHTHDSEAASMRQTQRSTSSRSEGGVSTCDSVAAAAGTQAKASHAEDAGPEATGEEAGSCCSSRTTRDNAVRASAPGNGARLAANADCSRASSSDSLCAGLAPANGMKVIDASVGRTVNAVAAAAGGVRGTTVCVAKIGRSDQLHEDVVRTPSGSRCFYIVLSSVASMPRRHTKNACGPADGRLIRHAP
jgi:hypothetical protein